MNYCITFCTKKSTHQLIVHGQSLHYLVIAWLRLVIGSIHSILGPSTLDIKFFCVWGGQVPKTYLPIIVRSIAIFPCAFPKTSKLPRSLRKLLAQNVSCFFQNKSSCRAISNFRALDFVFKEEKNFISKVLGPTLQSGLGQFMRLGYMYLYPTFRAGLLTSYYTPLRIILHCDWFKTCHMICHSFTRKAHQR